MRFEKTNEMLLNFNVLSVSRYESVEKDFHRYTTLLIDMKKDLDNAHSRIKLVRYVCLYSDMVRSWLFIFYCKMMLYGINYT